MTQYEKYKNLFDALDYSFQGIRLNHVLACCIWETANGKNLFSWKHLFRCLLGYDVRQINVPPNQSFIASYGDIGRDEHFNLFKSVVKKLSPAPVVTNFQLIKKHLSIHVQLIPIFFNLVFVVFKKAPLTLYQRFQFSSYYIFYCNLILDLQKRDWSGVKRYLCMCHVLDIENLMTQFLKMKKVETYSLQEGVYIVMEKQKVLGSIAYELFATDNLLCWGQYTKDEYTKYGIDPRRISVAGYPKWVHLDKVIKSQCKSCLVMLAGPIFGDVNLKLLSILKQLQDKMTITLKSHPANHVEMEKLAKDFSFNIIDKGVSVGDCFISGKFDLCIGVNTTAYYESWMAGIPCIRYGDERFDSYKGFDDEFSTIDELEDCLTKIKNTPKGYNEVSEMLRYAIGYGLDNYNMIVNENH